MTSPPHEKSRPAKAAHSMSIAADSTSVSPTGLDSQYPIETAQRRGWARQRLEAGPGWPMYGSQAWNALPLDDARRTAACVAAAEAYTRHYDDLEANLRTEIEQGRIAHKRAEDEEYQQQAEAHRRQWSGRFNRTVVPTFEQRRQQQIEASERVAERARGRAPVRGEL